MNQIEKYNYIKKHGIIKSCKDKIIQNVKITCSGGKDSTAVLLWAKENIKDLCNINVVYVNTLLEFIDVKDYVKYLCEKLKFKYEIREHTKENHNIIMDSFYKTAHEIGLPFRIRYCEHKIKQSLYKIKEEAEYDITCIGNRWGESVKRADTCFLYNQDRQIFYNPIMDLSSLEVYNKIKDNKIALYPSYKYLRRLSCALCPNMFMRVNVSADIYYVKNNIKKVSLDFFYKWLEIIANCDKSEYRDELNEKHRLFMRNYIKFQNMQGRKKLKEIKKPVYDYWEKEDKR